MEHGTRNLVTGAEYMKRLQFCVSPCLLPILSNTFMAYLDAGWWRRRGMWSTLFTSVTLLRMRTTPRAACAPRPRATRRCAASSPTPPSSSKARCKGGWHLRVGCGYLYLMKNEAVRSIFPNATIFK